MGVVRRFGVIDSEQPVLRCKLKALAIIDQRAYRRLGWDREPPE